MKSDAVVRALRARIGFAIPGLVLALASLGAWAQPVVEMELRTPVTVDSHGGGLVNDGGIWVTLTLVEGASAQGPFTLRMTLPPGVTYLGSNDTVNWSCGVAGQTLTCTAASLSLPWQGQPAVGIRLHLNADGTLPVPGSTTFRVTMESPQLPLPSPPDCTTTIVSANFATSRTGCVERVVPNRRSELGVASWDHTPTSFLAGRQQNRFDVYFHNVGFGYDNGPVTATVQLPPGFTFVSAGGLVSWSCTPQAVNAQGQRVVCTTGYFYDGMPDADTRLTMQVAVDAGIAVPGPHPVSATIANPQQPAPDMALCSDVDPPLGCGHYEIPTALPPLSRMDILSTGHSPAQFPLGSYGVLELTVANIGEATAGAGDLKLALPPGVAFDSVNYSQIPGTGCSTSGTVATGQTVSCTFASGLPNTGSYDMAFRLVADASAQSPARVVMAIGDATRPGPSLASCSADPEAVGCAAHVLDLSPWLFCDGFERLPHICGQPQGF